MGTLSFHDVTSSCFRAYLYVNCECHALQGKSSLFYQAPPANILLHFSMAGQGSLSLDAYRLYDDDPNGLLECWLRSLRKLGAAPSLLQARGSWCSLHAQ